MQRQITDDIAALLLALPPHIVEPLRKQGERADLLEIVLDLGRPPTARFPGQEVVLSERDVSEADIDYVVARIGAFGDDNRAGIERTLHRISAIRNRKGRIVGLTCRIGRAVYGTIAIIEDLIRTGTSILLLGRPGVGKTTMLREVARVLADEMGKRVIIVDTSNEIGGDGDIPHPAIGKARRMQVPTPTMQHAVMIEAVENHMPEVIVIDEIGTELEAAAARTIAERGVQLVGTAHGNTLENLMMNPTLSDLIGGIQSVTISDEEARRRGTQKSILERKAPPTFNIVVEIQNWEKVAVHANVGETVDAILRGQPISPEVRVIGESGELRRERGPLLAEAPETERPSRLAPATATRAVKIFPFGISRNRLEQAIRELEVPATVVSYLDQADVVMTVKNYYRKKPPIIRDAESNAVPIYVLKSNTVLQMQQILGTMFDIGAREADPLAQAMQETEDAIDNVIGTSQPVDLSPQNAYIRRLQHQMAERYNLASRSYGKEPHRRVRIYRSES